MSNSTKSFQSHGSDSKQHKQKRKRSFSDKAPFRKHRPHQDPSARHSKHGSSAPHNSGRIPSIKAPKIEQKLRKSSTASITSLLEDREGSRSTHQQASEEPAISVTLNGKRNIISSQVMDEESDIKDSTHDKTGRVSDKILSGASEVADHHAQISSPSTTSQHQYNFQNRVRGNPIPFNSSKQSVSLSSASKKRRHLNETVVENNKRLRLTDSLSKSLPGTGTGGNKFTALGLRNPHVLCYRRSVLQALLNIPILVNWLLLRARQHRGTHDTNASSKRPLDRTLGVSSKGQDECLFCAFADLAEDMWHRRRITALNKFDRSIRSLDPHRIHDWTRSAVQADAHEFLHALIDYIMEPRHGFNNPSPVVQALFGLRIAREWACKTCGLVHTAAMTDETGLQLPITEPSDGCLGDYLDGYFQNDCVDARCENEFCPSNPPRARKGQRDPQLPKRRRKVEVASTPEVLFVQLMRFQSTYSASGRVKTTKLKKHVAYSRTLSLAEYAMPCLRESSADSSALLSYKLASVVAHSGSKDSGHYISYVQSQGGTVLEISDESVRKSSQSEMLRPPDGFVPYILAYVRQDGSALESINSAKIKSPSQQASEQVVKKVSQTNGVAKLSGPLQHEKELKHALTSSTKQGLSAQTSLSPSPSALGQLSLRSSSSDEEMPTLREDKVSLDKAARVSVDFIRKGISKSGPSANQTSSVVQKRPAWAMHGKKAKFGHARLWRV